MERESHQPVRDMSQLALDIEHLLGDVDEMSVRDLAEELGERPVDVRVAVQESSLLYLAVNTSKVRVVRWAE